MTQIHFLVDMYDQDISLGNREGTKVNSVVNAGLACFVDTRYMQESQLNEATLEALDLVIVDYRAKSFMDVGQDLAFMSASLCGDLSLIQ